VNELPVTRQVADNLWRLWAQHRWSARRLTAEHARADAVSPTGEMIFKTESGLRKRLAERRRAGVGPILQVSTSSWLARRLP
jgi:hypothetical protein